MGSDAEFPWGDGQTPLFDHLLDVKIIKDAFILGFLFFFLFGRNIKLKEDTVFIVKRRRISSSL